MRVCASCGHVNPDKIAICLNCAASLGRQCPACGEQVSGSILVCGQCGAALPAERQALAQAPKPGPAIADYRAMMPMALAEKISRAPQIQGERREVTALALDIHDYTPTTRLLDSEELYFFIDEALRLLAQVVYRYEGTVDKVTPNGFLGLFGAPLAHENDPERAVRAALEMISAIQPLQRQIRRTQGFDLRLRIGINSGLVVAGKVSGDLQMEYSIGGDTVNLAMELQAAAEPGTILGAFETYQRTQPIIRYQVCPEVRLGDLPEPIQAYRPLELLRRPGNVRGLAGLQVPMIGRTGDLELLQTTLAEVQAAGTCRQVVVLGEAGLGKSRLVSEFAQQIHQEDVRFYKGNCQTFGRPQPYWVINEILREMIQQTESDPIAAQRQALEAYLERLNLNSSDVSVYLVNLLGLAKDDPEIHFHLGLLDVTMLQRQTYSALRQLFLAAAREKTTVLVCDDLHWIDPASRDFLEYLVQSTNHVPLMFVLLSRSEEGEGGALGTLLTSLQKNAEWCETIELTTLSDEEARLLVDQLIKQTSELARTVKQRIVERAGGNPFYMEEIVRMLIDQGGLAPQEEAWRITPEAGLHLNEVPGTLKGLILTRFDRLPATLRKTLQTAAVVGRSFPVSLLRNLEIQDEQELDSQLRELEKRQFLVSQPFGNEQGYTFNHVLIQETIYGTLLRRDRRSLHGRVAQVIERDPAWMEEESTEVLAYHYSESEELVKALPHLYAAAENAIRRSANESAVQHYRLALATMAGSGSTMSLDYFRVLIGLARALKFLGELAEAGSILEEVFSKLLGWSLKTEPGDLALLLVDGLKELGDIRAREGALDEATKHLEVALKALGERTTREQLSLWRSIMDRMAFVRFRQGKLVEAYDLAQSAVHTFNQEQPDDPITLANLFNSLGGILWQQGNTPEAITYVERSMQLYKTLGYSWGVANTNSNLGILYFQVGDWSKAAENWELAYRLRQEIGDVQNQALNLANLGHLRMTMGDHETARQNLLTSLAIREQLGDAWGIAHVHVSLAQLDLVRGDLGQAGHHARLALTAPGVSGSREIEIQARLFLALAEEESAGLESSLKAAEEALALAQADEPLDFETDCLRVLGVLNARAGDYSKGEALLRVSTDICRRHNDPYRLGLALLELGRLFQRLAHPGNPARVEWQAKAVSSLMEAWQLFKTLGAAYDLGLAQELLQQLGEVSSAVESSSGRPGALALATPLSHQAFLTGGKQVATILWFSLTSAGAADVEELFEAVSLTLAPLLAIAEEYKGEIIQRQDGLTVVFGAPISHENDPELAVETAWYMWNYLRRLPARRKAPLIYRLAVSKGEVTAGYIGQQGKYEFMVVGEPVQQAQRIAEQAPAGKVWIDRNVQAATERLFVFQPAPADVVEAMGGLPLLELAGLREDPAPARGVPGLRSKLIGRDLHFQSMLDMALSLKQSRGGMIWLEGQAGIGKSRLMWEFASRVSAEGALVWAGYCSQQQSNHVFSLFSNLLAHLFNLQISDTTADIYRKIERTVASWPAEARATRSFLELLAGVRPTGLEGDRLTNLEPDQLRQQTFVAVRSLLQSMAVERPLVILLDDLQWIDTMSADLLLFLSHMVRFQPVLFICSRRWEEAERPDERLARIQGLHLDQTVFIFLDHLSLRDSEMLLSELLSRAELPTEWRSAILSRSAGNPYYIEEFVRMLIEQNYLIYQQEHWAVNLELDIHRLSIPSSLEALIRSRYDALPWELKHVMQVASVIGRPFDSQLLETVADLPEAGALLGRLLARGMMRQTAEAQQWQFNHSLIGHVVYNTLLRAQRQGLHQALAQALEARWTGAEADHADELAYHFREADQVERARHYLVLAGERAAARYANTEALGHFTQAAELLAMAPKAPAILLWRIIVGLGDVLRFTGKYVESMDRLKTGLPLLEMEQLTNDMRAGLYRRLGESAQKQGDYELAHRYFGQAMSFLDRPATTAEQIEAARVTAKLAWSNFQQGRLEEGKAACEASLEHARSANSLSELATAENILGGIHFQQGQADLALDHTRRAKSLWEAMGYTWGVATALSNLGILAVAAGDWAGARLFFEQSLELRQKIGDAEGMVIIHTNLATLGLDQGNVELARHHFRQSLDLAKASSMAYHIAGAHLGLAQVCLLEDNLAAVEAELTAGLNQAEAIGARERSAELYRVRAELFMATGELDLASEAAGRSVEIAVQSGTRMLEAPAWRVVAEIELLQEDLAAARRALASAQEALEGSSNELELGRLTALTGRLQRMEGDGDRANEHYLAARAIFQRLGARRDLERLEREMAQSG